jgi:hypothetical protein
MGMCIVDMHRLYHNIKNERYSDVDILEFSDMICKDLVKHTSKYNKWLATLTGNAANSASILERICNKNGSMRFEVTDKQVNWGRSVGKSIHLNCFVCRKYLTDTGVVKYQQTTFRCSDCQMPLCKKDRSVPEIGRYQSCVDEHIELSCQTIGHFAKDHNYSTFPREKQVQLVVRRWTRSMLCEAV